MSSRTLFVVSARLDRSAREAVVAGRWPRKDFFGIAEALHADVLDETFVERDRLGRLLARRVGVYRAQIALAFLRRKRYSVIFCDGEHTGLPLSVLLSMVRRPPRLVMIGHLLTTPGKRAVLRRLRPQRRIDTMILHATRQVESARSELGFAESQVALLPYQVDPEFWSARPAVSDEAVICTAGLEYRDYPTLFKAVDGLPLRLVVAAGSRWSTHRATEAERTPSNVEVTSLDYDALRTLYAGARFVVVPLHDIENQAGVTTMLEAMSMGKAVIVTASRGQRDLVRGRLCTRDGVGSVLQGGPAVYGVSGDLAEAETGLYVPPGDPVALRTAISYLLAHPVEAERMGAAGRRVVAEHMSLDQFVRRIGILVHNARTKPEPPSTRRTTQTRKPRPRAIAGAR